MTTAALRNYNPHFKLVWKNILFFGITTAIAAVGTPLYAIGVGFERSDWVLFFFMASMTMMATTFGYHRLFSHRAFKAHPVIVFLNLFFGAGAFEQSALTWSSQHRDHHRFTDTDRDPYNIKRGFWHAHMGWFLFQEMPVDHSNVRDLAESRMIRNQHNWWLLWAIAAGFALPLAVGLLCGSFWGAFFLAVNARFVVVHQSVFLINSACHMFGRATYDDSQTARDSWICAIFTNGEGYHNFHHAFPNDYRNGVRWYHWDPTKWCIRFTSWFGLATELKRTPEVKIHELRLRQEHLSLQEQLQKNGHPKLAEALTHAAAQYERMLESLRKWEKSVLAYRGIAAAGSREHLGRAIKEMKLARENFFISLDTWKKFAAEWAAGAAVPA